MAERRPARGRAELTRISVTGSRDFYQVRNGNGLPVRVWRALDGLICECGLPGCVHIESLRICGFLEDPMQQSQAA
jgi:hypothetical protein